MVMAAMRVPKHQTMGTTGQELCMDDSAEQWVSTSTKNCCHRFVGSCRATYDTKDTDGVIMGQTLRERVRESMYKFLCARPAPHSLELANHIFRGDLCQLLRRKVDLAVRIQGVEVAGVLSDVVHLCKFSLVLPDHVEALHEGIPAHHLLTHGGLNTVALQSNASQCKRDHSHDHQAGKAREENHGICDLDPGRVRDHLLRFLEPAIDAIAQRGGLRFSTPSPAHHHHVQVGVLFQRQAAFRKSEKEPITATSRCQLPQTNKNWKLRQEFQTLKTGRQPNRCARKESST